MDYAMKKGISLSTLRRHIKSNKIEYKVENGRYLLFDNGGSATEFVSAPVSTSMVSAVTHPSRPEDVRVRKLEMELHKAREEIAELKMLIALYEDKITPARSINN